MPAGAPELLQDFGLSPARAAGWTLVAFGVLAVVVEPWLLALAQGRRERALRTAGLVGMALATLAAAAAPSYWTLLLALAVYGPASGLGTQLSEAALVAARPGREEAVLARWTLLGELGDLVAPAALAVSVALGAGWRGALAAVGVLALGQAVAAWRAPRADGVGEDEEDEGVPVREVLRAAVRSPGVLGWSLAATACTAMDELLTSFGALWLEARVAAGPSERAVVLGAWVVGAVAGAAVLERVAARVRPSVLLAVTGLGGAAAYGAWLGATDWRVSAVAFGAAGAFVTAHFPLLRARAFAAARGRTGVVVTAGSLLGPVELLFPLGVGLVADGAGVLAALLVLLVQPVVVLVGAVGARRAGT